MQGGAVDPLKTFWKEWNVAVLKITTRGMSLTIFTCYASKTPQEAFVLKCEALMIRTCVSSGPGWRKKAAAGEPRSCYENRIFHILQIKNYNTQLKNKLRLTFTCCNVYSSHSSVRYQQGAEALQGIRTELQVDEQIISIQTGFNSQKL